jgi:hypothetical protein
MQKGVVMDNAFRLMGRAMDITKDKLAWYAVTLDNQYLDEGKKWMEVVNNYMKEIISAHNNQNQ